MTTNDDTLVLPVGHFIGRLGRAPYGVRVGRRGVGIDSDTEFQVWRLAYGAPGRRPWTRSALLAAASAAKQPDAEATLDKLRSTGLITEVAPGTPAAIEFAAAYRLVPLLSGVAEAADVPDRHHLGVNGRPYATVDSWAYAVWCWAPLSDNLWRLAQESAALDAEDPTEESPATEEDVLDDLLDAAQALLASGAAYLDESRPTR